MRARDFLDMAGQDIETHSNKDVLENVVKCMRDVLEGNMDADVDASKTAEGCLAKMREHAKRKAKGNVYAMTIEEAQEVVREYLGVQKVEVQKISLEDFI